MTRVAGVWDNFRAFLHHLLVWRSWIAGSLAPVMYWAVVEQVESFKFLGIHITNKLTWSKHTKTVM